jgi:hypothetical protein
MTFDLGDLTWVQKLLFFLLRLFIFLVVVLLDVLRRFLGRLVKTWVVHDCTLVR